MCFTMINDRNHTIRKKRVFSAVSVAVWEESREVIVLKITKYNKVINRGKISQDGIM